MLRDVVCLLGSACVVCLCAVLSIPKVPRTLVPRTCSWSFAGYMPSLWEREWSAHVDEWQDSVCARMDVPREEAWAAMETANDMVFSRMEYVNTCTGERLVESLEPLVGLLRHPYFCTKGEAFLTDKSYMVIPRTVAHRIGLRHAALFFDAGASLYDDGVGGASQKWMVEQYAARGVHWHGIWAWEATALSPVEVWRRVPRSLKPVYHWYNVPVETEGGENPLDFIRQMATVDDHVVLKIDIDSPEVETRLVNLLLRSKELLALVDELYFEHHVDVAPMHPYWGRVPGTSLSDSYRLFTELRKRGVAAHAWV